MRREFFAVYPILDVPRRARLDALLRVAEDVVAGGARIVQLRAKDEAWARLVELLIALRPSRLGAMAAWVVNDRLDVALGFDAAGVHLGQSDAPVTVARRRAAGRADFLVGQSVGTVAEARRGRAQGADYLSVSPLFPTATKPDAPPAAGLAGLRAIRRTVPDLPLVAIGGIRPSHLEAVAQAGADGVSFISALRHWPRAAVASMRRAWEASLLPAPLLSRRAP